MVFWIGLAVLVAFMVFVRVSPIDPAVWHVPVAADQDRDLAGGAVRVVPGDAEMLQRMDAVLRDVPRTRVLDGSVQTGHITYVTRSAVFGFPDMTTVQLRDGEIRLFARLRFGASDLGVNRARLERVISAAQR